MGIKGDKNKHFPLIYIYYDLRLKQPNLKYRRFVRLYSNNSLQLGLPDAVELNALVL